MAIQLPLHWRVRLAVWLPAAAGLGLGLWASGAAGSQPMLIGLAVLLTAGLALAGQGVVHAALRLREAAAPTPVAPEPMSIGAAAEGPVAPGTLPAVAETVVLFRPVTSLPGLDPCGVEAELRWMTALEGLLPPAAWPGPLSAECATALLDRWLMTACRQFQAWAPTLGNEATLWLPLGEPWLTGPAADALEPAVARATAAAGLAPQRLCLRLVPQREGRSTVLPATAMRLHALGCSLAADGFGAGAASLAQLQQLPLRAVCLPASLVDRAAYSASARLVVESTARLATSLGIRTLADGVGSPVLVELLAAAGCDLAQGDAVGPWLEVRDWPQRRLGPPFADSGTDAAALG
jgi:EAL domain-containing protein (putative c-di-GMP-specific phosphodiesterase class I)